MIRGYHRRRGWLAWHTAYLSRVDDFPDLHELTGLPPREESDQERAERHYRNSMAWAIVTGGAAAEPDKEAT